MQLQESDIRFFNLSKGNSHIKYIDINLKLSIPLDEGVKRDSVKQLIDTFIKVGWNKSWIETKLANLCDEDIAQLNHEDIIYGLSCIWLVHSHIIPSCFKEAYSAIGLTKQATQKIMDVINPLINTCYCSEQLLDIGLEWLISCM